MAKTYNRMMLDVAADIHDIITEVQGDQNSRYLDVYLFNNGVPIDLTGHTVRIYMRRPKTNPLSELEEFFNDGEITEATEGRCQFLMSTQALAKFGHLEAQISIWKGTEEILSTQKFRIMVTENLRVEGEIEGSNEYGALVILFQNLYEAYDLMVTMIENFGKAGDIAAERDIATFWQGMEYLMRYMDTDLRTLLEETIQQAMQSAGGSGDMLFVLFGLYSDDEGIWEWCFRQPQIGQALNAGFNLGSDALDDCESVAEIVANADVIAKIGANADAVAICSKDPTLAAALISYMDDESVLAAGLGYQKYAVGDEVTLDWYGNPTTFIVTHKGYKTSNKIVLHSKYTLGGVEYSTYYNYYSGSVLRTHLNTTVLEGFSDRIQAAIVPIAVACHDKTTAVTCYDKIWALSYAEAGLGTNTNAPVEGSKLSYFSAAAKRQKGGYWWLRTPSSDGRNLAWYVDAGGTANNCNTAYSSGVVPAFEI